MIVCHWISTFMSIVENFTRKQLMMNKKFILGATKLQSPSKLRSHYNYCHRILSLKNLPTFFRWTHGHNSKLKECYWCEPHQTWWDYLKQLHFYHVERRRYHFRSCSVTNKSKSFRSNSSFESSLGKMCVTIRFLLSIINLAVICNNLVQCTPDNRYH